jgi:hypothetical protein
LPENIKPMEPSPHLPKDIKASSSYARTFYFISGIIATLAYRIIFLLDGVWIKIVWYIGTVGFIFYFWHRTRVETKRAEMVHQYKLIPAIEDSTIPPEQKSALRYLIETTMTSKARFNSAFILISSIVALIISIFLDLLHH